MMSKEDVVMTAAMPIRYDQPQDPEKRRTVLVAGDTHAARFRARSTVDAAGLDVLDDLPPEQALDLLSGPLRLDAIWIELDNAPSLAARRLLERADALSCRLKVGLIIATSLEHVDEVLCGLSASADLLVGADEVERAGTLLLACGKSLETVGETGPAASAARLRQLSEEVSRIAAALSRLSTSSGGLPLSPATMAPPEGDLPQVSAEGLRAMIKARRLRASYLPADLFADPAWDMLLDLLQAEIVQHRVPVSSLCIAAAVPATTALRWIKAMTDRGLLSRRDDPQDGRRVFIEMAPSTSVSLRRYFKEAGLAAV